MNIIISCLVAIVCLFQVSISQLNLIPDISQLAFDNSNGCMQVDVTVNGPILCFGGTTGVIEVTVSGGVEPYLYSVNGFPAQTENVFSSLTAGSYTILVADSNDCEFITTEFIISEPSILNSVITLLHAPSCIDGALIEVNVSGGVEPYLYSINGFPAQTGNVFSNLMAGTHEILVIDANGCTFFSFFGIEEIPLLNSTLAVNNPICNGSNDGSIEVIASGGAEPYLYSISPNLNDFQANNTFINLGAGVYTVIVQDGFGCFLTIDVELNNPPEIDNSIIQTSSILTANQPEALYQWLDCDESNSPIEGEIDQSFTPSIDGNYAVSITQNDCTVISDCIEFFVLSVENSLKNSPVIYPNPSTGKITISLSKEYDDIQVKLIDMSGKIIKIYNRLNFKDATFDLDVNAGVYFLEIVSNQEKSMFRISKK